MGRSREQARIRADFRSSITPESHTAVWLARKTACDQAFNLAASIARLLFDVRTQKLPTNLAHLSVNGARPLAIAQWVSAHGVIAREFVDASLVGSGIGDDDTGTVGVCLSWWDAEGCQC
jgi:hypothetical protein